MSNYAKYKQIALIMFPSIKPMCQLLLKTYLGVLFRKLNDSDCIF